MTRGRRALFAAAAGVALAAGYSAMVAADLPVIDTGGRGQLAHQLANDVKAYGLQLQQYAGEVKSWATQKLQWLQQLQQYSVQLQQYTNELTMLQNWVRNPSLGAAMGLLNIAGLGNSLPVNAYAVLNLVERPLLWRKRLAGDLGRAVQPIEPDRGRLLGQPCLHPDRCQLGQPGADLQTPIRSPASKARRRRPTPICRPTRRRSRRCAIISRPPARPRTCRTPRRRSSSRRPGRPTRPPNSRRSTRFTRHNATRWRNATTKR